MEDQYGEFLNLVSIKTVYLERIVADRTAFRPQDNSRSLQVNMSGSHSVRTVSLTGFSIGAQVSVRADQGGDDEEDDQVAFSVDCIFVLDYELKSLDSHSEYITGDNDVSSRLSEMVKLFADRNVRVNVWPYARETIHSTTLRMGVPPLVLPLSIVSR